MFFSQQKLVKAFWLNKLAISDPFSASHKLFSIFSECKFRFIFLASVKILYARLCLSLIASSLDSSRVVMHDPLLQSSCACFILSYIALPKSLLLFRRFLSSVKVFLGLPDFGARRLSLKLLRPCQSYSLSPS